MNSTFIVVAFIALVLFIKHILKLALANDLMKISKKINKDIPDGCIDLYLQKAHLRSLALAVSSVFLWNMFGDTEMFTASILMGGAAGLTSIVFLASVMYGHVVGNDRPYIVSILKDEMKDVKND